MTTHVPHDDTMLVGLQDDCPRCLEHARRPLQTLDTPHLADLWRRMLAVEFDVEPGIVVGVDLRDGAPSQQPGGYRSDTERAVCMRLYEFACFLQTMGIPPDRVMPGVPYLDLPAPS